MSLTTDVSTASSGAPSHHLPDSVQPECARPSVPAAASFPSPGHPEAPTLQTGPLRHRGRPADMDPPPLYEAGRPPPGRAVRATVGPGGVGLSAPRQTQAPGRSAAASPVPVHLRSPPALGVVPH